MPYPDAVLWRGEHVLAHRRPHWRMLVVPALVPPVAAFLAGWVAALATALPSEGARTAARIGVVVLAVAAVGWFALLPLVRWRVTHFVLTDRRVLVREGVLHRESVDVAGVRITAVRTRRTPSERVLGAGTLVVATFGEPEPWEFAGLGDVEHLAALVEEMAADRGGLLAPSDEFAEDDDPDPELPVDSWGAWDGEDEDVPRRGTGRRHGRTGTRPGARTGVSRSRAARTSR